MAGPLIVAPAAAGALTLPSIATSAGLVVGGLAASGLGLSWLMSSAPSSPPAVRSTMNVSYQDFLKERLVSRPKNMYPVNVYSTLSIERHRPSCRACSA